jgi:hypothetical protein
MSRHHRTRLIIATGSSALALLALAQPASASITWSEPTSITWSEPTSITWGSEAESITWGSEAESITW